MWTFELSFIFKINYGVNLPAFIKIITIWFNYSSVRSFSLLLKICFFFIILSIQNFHLLLLLTFIFFTICFILLFINQTKIVIRYFNSGIQSVNISTNFFDRIQTNNIMESNDNNNHKNMQIHISKQNNKKAYDLNHTKILLNYCNFEIFWKSFSLFA